MRGAPSPDDNTVPDVLTYDMIAMQLQDLQDDVFELRSAQKAGLARQEKAITHLGDLHKKLDVLIDALPASKKSKMSIALPDYTPAQIQANKAGTACLIF